MDLHPIGADEADLGSGEVHPVAWPSHPTGIDAVGGHHFLVAHRGDHPGAGPLHAGAGMLEHRRRREHVRVRRGDRTDLGQSGER